MKIYRVAILGCRGRGTAAARAYHAHPRTELVGLCDLIPERLNTLGDALGVSARFTDLDEMIRQTAPDIVAIPTGTEFHYDLCMRVLEHGVHIEVEKPMCVDLIQADAVIAKAQQKRVRVAVHHQGRVGAAMQATGRAFNEGKIGELRYIYGSGKGYYGGYGLMNIGTHMINDMLKFGR
ncbi:Gfo/Idh/MocA family oxidoreductase, partial [Candidatus Poribacteria bacterium]|nr:Gfo/Idh/MocA family oxidoreductase [Candidatus Poribacteria bacterium]